MAGAAAAAAVIVEAESEAGAGAESNSIMFCTVQVCLLYCASKSVLVYAFRACRGCGNVHTSAFEAIVVVAHNTTQHNTKQQHCEENVKCAGMR